MANLNWRAGLSGAISSEDDFVGPQRVREAGERHFFSGIERVEEGLELRLVRMIGDVARVEHFHGEFAPLSFVQTTDLG